jgi:hypothetical protein
MRPKGLLQIESNLKCRIMNYVKLITEAYFEVNTSARYDFEIKKELFQQILTRKLSVLEKKRHITEKEFLTQCGLALNKVRNHVIETLEFRENPRYDYLEGGINRKNNIFVEIEDIGGKANRELSEDELNELDKLFGFIAMLYHKANQSQQPETEPETPQQLDKSKPFCFTNNFDHVQKEKVYNYFKTELVDKNFLSLDDLHKYLIIAFQDKTPLAERFIFSGNISIGIIRNIFYRYYTEIAQDKHGLKGKYCQLLGEYFNGFDTAKIKRNFNK